MALVYHGTPLTPREALVAAGARAFCVSFFRPADTAQVEAQAPFVMYDNGAFSYWMAAVRAGVDPMEAGRAEWWLYYAWLERRLFTPGRWAVIPDKPAAPSQLNDGLLNERESIVYATRLMRDNQLDCFDIAGRQSARRQAAHRAGYENPTAKEIE